MMFIADSLITIGLATISLGTIHEADGVQEHRFCLRNVGTKAVELVQGYTSCHCTTIDFDKGAILSPGDSTHVTLSFNPQGKGGDFFESGTIRYEVRGERREERGESEEVSEMRKALTIAMEGTCITSEETLLRQFPVRISDGIRLSTDRFDLGIMHVGETKERNVVLLHRDQNDQQECFTIRFTVDEKTPKGLQHIPFPVISNKEERTVYVTLDVIVK